MNPFKFNITILDDCDNEPNKTFLVQFTILNNTDLVRNPGYNETATITIIDDDDRPGE